ncbi:acyl-CoA desaturase [Streptomyces sp. UNOC14_S4]|uniref:fatty acid desaturase family protein n=1 Tax=Streptomyces sp. UNOC14_S4 TaxID=2872340 RepID=UPI001E60F7C4|nr:acyl-CoA desaturase [Streptomyces sp. UNOC14_S4]
MAHRTRTTAPLIALDRRPGATGGSDFARLARRVAGAGLMRRRPAYYAARFTLVAALSAAPWAVLALLGTTWWVLPVAALMALANGQVALLMHDVAHRQVFRTRRPTETVGRLVAGLGIGLGYGWWQDKHTRHHANPNHEELDPDVSPDILVWSRRQARESLGLARLVGRVQGFLFFPLLALEGLNLRVAGLRAVRNRSVRHRWTDAALMLAHGAGYLATLLLLMPPGQAIAFAAIHQALFGVYLGCIFAPNHKGMPTRTGLPQPDFLRRQVLTSRNVRGGLLTDIALGGLNHQIEHHLFPSMPAPHLRHARAIVRDYCAELGIPYHETGLIASYREAVAHLHRVGAPIRAAHH